MSPSNKIGKRGASCACSGLSSTATVCGQRAAFANTARNAVRGMGSTRHPAVRASIYSGPRRSPNSRLERLLVGKEEESDEKRVQPGIKHRAHIYRPRGRARIGVAWTGERASYAHGLRGCGGWCSGPQGRCGVEPRTLRGHRRARRGIGHRGDLCVLEGWAPLSCQAG